MPALVAQPIKRLFIYKNFGVLTQKTRFLIDVNEALEEYSQLFAGVMGVNAYIYRILNKEGKVLLEPKILGSIELINASPSGPRSVDGHKQAKGLYLALNDYLAIKLSIKDGDFIEVLVTSLISKSLGEEMIFPYETRIYASKKIVDDVQKEFETLSRIGRVFQSARLLAKFGLKDIANNLSEGYAWFEIGNHANAIKAYSKVIEGLRNYLQPKADEGKEASVPLIDADETRTEEIRDFLNKTHSLLSHFGEPSGTQTLEEESVFVQDLVEEITEYLIKKLQPIEKTPQP